MEKWSDHFRKECCHFCHFDIVWESKLEFLERFEWFVNNWPWTRFCFFCFFRKKGIFKLQTKAELISHGPTAWICVAYFRLIKRTSMVMLKKCAFCTLLQLFLHQLMFWGSRFVWQNLIPRAHTQLSLLGSIFWPFIGLWVNLRNGDKHTYSKLNPVHASILRPTTCPKGFAHQMDVEQYRKRSLVWIWINQNQSFQPKQSKMKAIADSHVKICMCRRSFEVQFKDFLSKHFFSKPLKLSSTTSHSLNLITCLELPVLSSDVPEADDLLYKK